MCKIFFHILVKKLSLFFWLYIEANKQESTSVFLKCIFLKKLSFLDLKK